MKEQGIFLLFIRRCEEDCIQCGIIKETIGMHLQQSFLALVYHIMQVD